MRIFAPIFRYLLPVALVGLVAHYALSDIKDPPRCAEPIAYTVLAPDPRFELSQEAFITAAEEAAQVWNEAAGKELFRRGDTGIAVSLVYDERQEALALGDSIEAGQQEYRAMKEEIDDLRVRYEELKRSYERTVSKYEADVAQYERDVASWNDRGGAPPSVYAQFAVRKATLERQQASLGSEAARIESLGRDINVRVASLNGLVERLNQNAEIFNETLGHDFDQGHYTADGDSEQITVYTFESREELVRVLAHELGHALGIGHTEDPESLMYPYNFGTSVSLSEEDRAALIEACAS